jgi:hypothetical protein
MPMQAAQMTPYRQKVFHFIWKIAKEPTHAIRLADKYNDVYPSTTVMRDFCSAVKRMKDAGWLEEYDAGPEAKSKGAIRVTEAGINQYTSMQSKSLAREPAKPEVLS